MKFTDQGEVEIKVEGESSRDGEATLRISVRDTGVGISPEKQKGIFGVFSQADASTTRRFGGTGLGLAISSQLVEMMNGRIWVESEVGQGSTFYFTATFGVQPADAQRTPENVSQLAEIPVLVVDDVRSESTADNIERQFTAMDILLVEDGLVNQKVAAGFLKGHNIVIACDGKKAVESMRTERFDIVLMDVQMPEMDGFEATRIIRKKEQEQGRHTPIIAMTASAMKGDRERCLAAGMDGYVAKPVTAEQLHEAIEKFATKGTNLGE